jgi:sugar lactone lactonase YvrE
LWWVDITAGLVHRFDPETGDNRTQEIGQMVGTVVVRQNGGLLVALEQGIATLDFDSGALEMVSQPEADKPNNRFNDGKCDPAGRLWAGTMSMQGEKNAGTLYCYEGSGEIRPMVRDVSTSNGIIWSLDEKTLYYIDTPTREVWAYDFDPSSGDIANRRTVVTVDPEFGFPDGMTIDAEDMLWVAHWGGWAVHRWDPLSGRRIDTIKVAAECVTSCAFGGDDLKTLYITTAGGGGDKRDQPEAGHLFAWASPVAGVPSTRFAG